MGVSAEVQMAQYAGKFACYPHCLPPTDGAVTRLGEEVPEDTCIDVGVPTNDARATVAQPRGSGEAESLGGARSFSGRATGGDVCAA